MDPNFQRIVVLIDMDCFYCQVEEQLDPVLMGKPIVVVQYNEWKGGGIIAVNYEARKWGISRHMRGDEAKKKCPELRVVSVPEFRGRANLNKYREAGKRVLNVLLRFSKLVQKASIDEAYLDITAEVEDRFVNFRRENLVDLEEKLPNTFVVGFDDIKDFRENHMSNDNLKLLIGAIIIEEIRAEILKSTGYKSSAGIANNKILAKLVCSLHKPNKQTILPKESLDLFLKDVPIRKINSLGGKFGNNLIDELKINNILELRDFQEQDLQKMYDVRLGYLPESELGNKIFTIIQNESRMKIRSWLYNICRGIDLEPVTPRLNTQSVGCSKKFPGRSALKTETDVVYWLNELIVDLIERLSNDKIENKRNAKQIVLHFAQNDNFASKSWNFSRKLNLDCKDETLKYLSDNLMALFKKNSIFETSSTLNITYLGLNAGKFENNVKDITDFFGNLKVKNSLSTNPQKKRKVAESESESFVLKWIENKLQTKFKEIRCPICGLKIDVFCDSNNFEEHLKTCYENQNGDKIS